jgi:hypothetical protein
VLGHAGDIVNYLFRQYGQGRSPSSGLLERYPALLVSTSLCYLSNRSEILHTCR